MILPDYVIVDVLSDYRGIIVFLFLLRNTSLTLAKKL